MQNDPFNQNASYPDPSQMSMGYNYNQQYNPSYSNMMFMNMNQSQLQQTMQIAQMNFHNHMQNVLQGTMAAGMSIYGQAQKVGSAFQERAYNDLYFGNGNFALERSTWRDMTWGMGLAGSDFGRAMKIGGRRPEYLSPEEYDFTMQRSWHHRKGELLDQIASGAGSASSTLMGMYGFKSLGMLKSIGAGMALDSVIGSAIQSAWVRPREYARGIREFTEVTSLNNRALPSVMSEEASDHLASSFYHAESSPWIRASLGMIPLIGDPLGKALEKRLTPDTMPSETFKKMSSLGLLRDVNPNDVDKIDSEVKNTIKIIEKFAGLANTTKDAIIQMKASFNNMGFNGDQQTTMLSNLTKTSLSTGIHIDQLLPMAQTYASMGYNSGFNKSIVAQSGLNELSAIKAMQEYGLIDRMQDAGSLSQMHLMNAQNFVKSGWGKVATFGGGNTAAAALYYKSIGGGNPAIGTVYEDMDGYGPDIDPIAAARAGWLEAKKILGGGLKGTSGAIGAFARSREEKMQIHDAIYGFDELGQMQAAGIAQRELAKRTGIYGNLAAFDILSLGNTRQGGNTLLNNRYADIKSATAYSDVDNGKKERLKDLKNIYNNEIANLYDSLTNGDVTSADKIRAQIISKAIKNGTITNRDEADHSLNLILKEREEAYDKVNKGGWHDPVTAIFRSFFKDDKYDKFKTIGKSVNKFNDDIDFKKVLEGRKSQRNAMTEESYKLMGDLLKDDPSGMRWLVSKMDGSNNTQILKQFLDSRVENGNISKIDAGKIFQRTYMNNEVARDLPLDSLERYGKTESLNRSGLNNYYNIMKSKGAIKVSRDEFGDRAKDLQQKIIGLSHMSGKQMRDWIHGDGQYLGDDLRAVYGEGTGNKLWAYLNEQSVRDPEAFRKKFMETFVAHGAVVSDADFKKAGIDTTSNPNDEALRQFTTAITHLNRILGAP